MQAAFDDPESDAGTALVLYLEMSNRDAISAVAAELYEWAIPEWLRAVPLVDDDQLEMAQRLAVFAETDQEEKVRHLALTCLNVVRSWAGLEPVLELLSENWRAYTAEELRVVTSALEKLLDVLYAPGGSFDPISAVPAARMVVRHDPGPILPQIAERLKPIMADPVDHLEWNAADQTLERIPRLQRRLADARRIAGEQTAE